MANNFGEPQSRNETILQNMLGENYPILPPESRIEVLLQALLEAWENIEPGGGGGGGGSITVDSDFSTTSTNPVENKVITVNFNLMRSQMPSTISGLDMNTTCGSMSAYAIDLNTVTSSGFYNAMECTNAPYSYMMLIVCGYYVSGYCLQLACDVSTGAMKRRNCINGTWTDWEAIETAWSPNNPYGSNQSQSGT